MKEWFYRLRYKIAYAICAEYFNDIEDRLSSLLEHVTGGRLSKTGYPVRVMTDAVDDYWEERCDECEYYRACCADEKGGEE